MSDEFIFQVEVSDQVGPTTVRVEGRCCGGDVRTGDVFLELETASGGPAAAETQAVVVQVASVTSIPPGLLGICETGTLVLELPASLVLSRGAMLKGYR